MWPSGVAHDFNLSSGMHSSNGTFNHSNRRAGLRHTFYFALG
jgi:hypothetical protein